jgi:hypothetical protein
MSLGDPAAGFQFELLENCYVSGGEIRPMPGAVCVLDPTTDARLATDVTPFSPRGWDADHYDARRPVSAVDANGYPIPATPTESMLVWTRPTTLHSVHYVGNRWVFLGESDGRREPVYNAGETQWVYVTAYQGDGAGTNIDLTLSQAPLTTSGRFNAVRAGSTIYLEGFTGDHAAALNNKQHVVSGVAGAVVTITTNYTGSHAAFTGQTGFIGRVTPSWDFAYSADPAGIGEDVESLTVWRTATNSATPGNADDQVLCSHVANRRRDFGDATGTLETHSKRKQRSIPYRVVPHVAGNRIIVAAPGYGCVFQVPNMLPPSLTGAVGAGGLAAYSNTELDQPQSLGVPKCIALEDPDKTVATTMHVVKSGSLSTDNALEFGGSNGAVSGRAGVYKWIFAYRNEATGEVGIPCEPITVTTDSSAGVSERLRFHIRYPGYTMPECAAMSILAFRTIKNGDTFYYDSSIPLLAADANAMSVALSAESSGAYGLTPTTLPLTDGYCHYVLFEPRYQTDAKLVQLVDDSASGSPVNVNPSTVNQMPMGCKTAQTYRGFTMFGGALGDTGLRRELQAGTLQLVYDRNASTLGAAQYYPDRIITRFDEGNLGGGAFAPPVASTTGFGTGAEDLPSSYAGQNIYSTQMFPFPRRLVTFNKTVNTTIGTADVWDTQRHRAPDTHYEILNSPAREQEDINTGPEPAYLVLPRGKVQVSNPDHPGETPATNTIVVSAEDDQDIEAMGSAGGQPVICTKDRTYFLGFSTTPVGGIPDIVSDKFGCIAPNSMVSFDGGCAWISSRGPVAMIGGEFRWIGEPLQQWFTESTSRYKKDSLGMMRHAWACHDPIRGLIYFGLFADRAVGTSAEIEVSYRGTSYSWSDTNGVGALTADQIRSRFPCDEVLVYSYRDDGWSVWRPGSWQAIQWMTVGQDSTQTTRVFFLGHDKRLYALDDLWGQSDEDSNLTTIAQTGLVSTITGLTTGIKMQVGMDVAFYKGGSGTKLEFIGLRTIASKTSSEITLDSSVTLPQGGCKMLVAPHRMKLRTNWVSWKDSDHAGVGKLGIRYSLWSRYSTTSGGVGAKLPAFVRATVRTAASFNGLLTRKESSMTADGYSPVGEDVSASQTFEHGLGLGFSQGQGHQVELDVIGGTQLRLSDLFAEVG